jgi:hypothetical protein
MTINGANIGPATGISAASLPLSSSLGGVTVAVTPASCSAAPGLIAYPTLCLGNGHVRDLLVQKVSRRTSAASILLLASCYQQVSATGSA